ncbi:hypothetical protein JW777_10755 [bacterium]|nr:hypothetical protein [bacterium]
MRIRPAPVESQIRQYRGEYGRYRKYAEVLREILEAACRDRAPLAIVQSRAKTVSSFAEKIVRKPTADPIHDFTDLCGARVITNTRNEVKRLCRFIRDHFRIDEENSQDTFERLKTSEFGYLSVHYIVQIDRPSVLGVRIPKEIGGRKAEIQVRTLLQHAWANMSHDLIYKNRFDVPQRWTRNLARTSALLEQADSVFDDVLRELEAYRFHYGVFSGKSKWEEEFASLERIIRNEPDETNKPSIALRIARMHKSRWNWDGIVACLRPYGGRECRERPEIVLEYGYALCRKHRDRPLGRDYLRGQALMAEAVRLSTDENRADALSRHAWSYENIKGRETKARELYRLALDADPKDPYVFASFLEYELYCSRDDRFIEYMKPSLLRAVDACRSHVRAGIELPWAFFTMGKLHLLLNQPYESLSAYAAAVRSCLGKEACGPRDVFQEQRDFLVRINTAREWPAAHRWVERILILAQAVRFGDSRAVGQLNALRRRRATFAVPVVIVAGGTDASVQARMEEYRPALTRAFDGFSGTVISGGTRAGIPGLIGEIARNASRRKGYGFAAVSYLPGKVPAGVEIDQRYRERIVLDGDDFTPEQPIQNWIDMIASGINPSDVRVLGINGGRIAAFEYRLALALGARVGIVHSSGRAESEIRQDSRFSAPDNLLWLPLDDMTLRAFVNPGKTVMSSDHLDRAGRAIHAAFLSENRHRVADPGMLPWEELAEDLRQSNRDQAAYAVQILGAVGYGVRKSAAARVPVRFSKKEIEIMAEMEHGRWVVERLCSGWRYGEKRDPVNRISPHLVPWKELADKFKEYDCIAVRKWPDLLKNAGLEIYRLKR